MSSTCSHRFITEKTETREVAIIGPEILASSFEEAEQKAAALGVRVIGVLDPEDCISEAERNSELDPRVTTQDSHVI